MGPGDATGNGEGHPALGRAAVFDVLEDLGLAAPAFGMLLQVGDRPGVEIPAVVIKPLDAAQVGFRLPLELHQAVDDVHDLDAGVVEIVLDLDGFPLGPEAPDEGVAQAGVPEMADVGRFVGVDVRMLDDDLPFLRTEGAPAGRSETFGEKRVRVQKQVDEAGPGDFQARNPRRDPDLGRHFLGDFPGIVPDFFGQGEGKREGQVAEFGLGRIEKIDLFPDDGVDLFQPLVENGPEFFFQGKHNRLIIAQGF